MWTIILALTLTGLFVAPASVFALTWCVPTAIVGTSCPKVSPTIQGALDALPGSGNHVIKVGPGNPPERIVVAKRAQIKCFGDDAVIRDEGLEPGGILVEYVGPLTLLGQPISCKLDVYSSEKGIYVPHDVVWFKLEDSTLSRIGERAGVGVLIDGTGGPIHAKRSWAKNSVIRGFGIGGDYIDAAWIKPEPATWQDNGIGLRCRNCQGQIFYNTFLRNGVGLHMVTIPAGEAQVGALDINANDFGTVGNPDDGNNVAVQWDRCVGRLREFNHNDLYENAVAFRVETDPGVYVEGDTAYYSAIAEASNSFADVEVCRDGVCTTYDTAAFNAGGATCP